MTATHETAVRRSSLTPATTAIFAVLGLADIVLLAAVGSADAPPLAVSILFAAFGSSPWRRCSRPAGPPWPRSSSAG